MRPTMIIGFGLLAMGVVELVVVVRTRSPRWLVAQGIVFAELGLLHLIPPLFPSEAAQVGVSAVLGLSILWAAILQVRLVRQAHPRHDGDEAA